MKKLSLIFLVIFTLSPFRANAEVQLLKYPENEHKVFLSAEEYYKKEKLHDYHEFKKATFSLRKKLLYKNLEKVLKNESSDKIDYKIFHNLFAHKHSQVSPNRQVYLYCSVIETKDDLQYKFIMIDAETSELLVEGDGTHYK
ncbi:hypothetical protein CU633_02515 [Bacillus sp. V3-13]|uniref:hypothetical protein n=1 Tax=Bacillus sp. V3-13 TaxID=2053728 RepID=UPI000C78215B|nr:hypothetical protein [Bacillus sp. V3-13]PLR79075.1 hypothetical protein CU633_02515 [Bacillus sp. V3-13]